MSRDDIIRTAREASEETNWKPALGNEHVVEFLERFATLVAAAERDRTARLVADMQSELQTLRDRLARQRPVLWRLKDNPTITVEGRPSNPGPWEALGPIV